MAFLEKTPDAVIGKFLTMIRIIIMRAIVADELKSTNNWSEIVNDRGSQRSPLEELGALMERTLMLRQD